MSHPYTCQDKAAFVHCHNLEIPRKEKYSYQKRVFLFWAIVGPLASTDKYLLKITMIFLFAATRIF